MRMLRLTLTRGGIRGMGGSSYPLTDPAVSLWCRAWWEVLRCMRTVGVSLDKELVRDQPVRPASHPKWPCEAAIQWVFENPASDGRR